MSAEYNPPLKTVGNLAVMYIASFALVVFFAITLQQIGAPVHYGATLMVSFLATTWLFAGFFAGTMRLSVFHRAHEAGAAPQVGQAVAAGLISSMVYLLLPGEFYQSGLDALAIYFGWMLGAVFLAILAAPTYASARTVTLTELLVNRDSSMAMRIMCLLAVVICSLLLALVQFQAIGRVGELLLGIPGPIVVSVSAAVICICILFGGLQSLSITRAMIYPVIAIAFLTPLVWLSAKLVGFPIPQFSFGAAALQPVSEIDAELLKAGFATAEEMFSMTSKGQQLDSFNFVALILCIAAAIAAMPHLVQHFGVLGGRAKARRSGVFAVLFLFIVISAAPAAAAFTKLELYSSLLGLQLFDLPINAEWLFEAGNISAASLVSLCGEHPRSLEQVISACGGSEEHILSVQDIGVELDMAMFAMATLGDLPMIVKMLLATGALAALWSTADGALFAAANTLSEDGYFKNFQTKSPLGIRLFIARITILTLTVLVAAGAVWMNGYGRFLFDCAFAIGASVLFPLLLMKSLKLPVTPTCQLAAMTGGMIVTIVLLLLTSVGMDMQFGTGDEFVASIPFLTDSLLPINSGFLGMMVAFTFLGAGSRRMKTKNYSTVSD